MGLIADTGVETSVRFAAELGDHVTLVRDATAALSAEAMHAAQEVNGPAHGLTGPYGLFGVFPVLFLFVRGGGVIAMLAVQPATNGLARSTTPKCASGGGHR